MIHPAVQRKKLTRGVLLCVNVLKKAKKYFYILVGEMKNGTRRKAKEYKQI